MLTLVVTNGDDAMVESGVRWWFLLMLTWLKMKRTERKLKGTYKPDSIHTFICFHQLNKFLNSQIEFHCGLQLTQLWAIIIAPFKAFGGLMLCKRLLNLTGDQEYICNKPHNVNVMDIHPLHLHYHETNFKPVIIGFMILINSPAGSHLYQYLWGLGGQNDGQGV